MADETFRGRVKKVVADLLGIPETKVTPTAHFVRDLGMASVQSIELIAAFEEEFEIEVDQNEVADIFTLDDAAAWIEEAVEKRQG